MSARHSKANFAQHAVDNVCACTDKLCPACYGLCARLATTTLARIDMNDTTGTLFCDSCADDAYNSGVFAVREQTLNLLQ